MKSYQMKTIGNDYYMGKSIDLFLKMIILLIFFLSSARLEEARTAQATAFKLLQVCFRFSIY